MADHQFEKKLSQQMADFKLKPAAEVWQRVESQIQKDRKRRRWFFILPIAALLLGGVLYAVWPLHTSTKNEAVAALNNTTAQAIEANKPDSLLTITESSTEVPEQKVAAATTVTQPQQQAEKKESSAETNNTAEANKTAQAVIKKTVPVQKVVQTKVTQQPAAGTISKTEEKINKSSSRLIKDDKLIEETKRTVDTVTTAEVVTNQIIQQPDTAVANTTSVFIEKDSAVADLVTVDSAAAKLPVPQISIPKRKLQWGLHVNAGISDIRESFFPGAGMKAETVSYFGGGISNQPSTNISRVTRYEYAVRPSIQFGAGVTVRKPFKKKHAFVTGLQYQYSSYNVTQLQKVDTFLSASNLFSNISTRERRAGFRMHALSIPLEVEWKLAAGKKATWLLNAGLHQSFTIASTQTDTLYSFRYTATTDRFSASAGSGGTTIKETKATAWQPMLYLSPAYEWRSKKFASQLGLYLNYGLRPAYKASEQDYWLQTGIRYRIYFNR